MGVNDLAEQLEVAIEECARLERENAELLSKLTRALDIAQEANDDCRRWVKKLAAARAVIERAHRTSIAMDGRSAVVLPAVRDILATYQNGADQS